MSMAADCSRGLGVFRRLRTWSLTMAADLLAIRWIPDSLVLIKVELPIHRVRVDRSIACPIGGSSASDGLRLQDILGRVFRQDSCPPALKKQKVKCAGNDQAERGERRRKAAPAARAVNLGAGPTDIDDNEEPPDDRDRVDRQSPSAQRKVRARLVIVVGRPATPGVFELPAGGREGAVGRHDAAGPPASGIVTSRYARLAQTMATEQSVSITLGRLIFTTRIAAASTPTTTDGHDRGLRPRLHVGERSGRRGGCCRAPSRT